MRGNPRLIIDIGTNSVLSLVAAEENGNISVISESKITTRLGENLHKTGVLSSNAMIMTADAVNLILNEMEYDSILILGTEALRKAHNSEEFRDILKAGTGYDVTIVTGKAEAELSFFGSFYNIDPGDGPILTADVGAGSTELGYGSTEKIELHISIPLGAMILKDLAATDSIKAYYDTARSILQEKLGGFLNCKAGTFLVTGGTITSTGAIYRKLESFEAGKIHGMSLKTKDILEIAARFESTDKKKRAGLIPFDPERYDIMLPGMGIIQALMSIFNMNDLVVSNGGLRYGAVLRPDLVVSC